MPFEVLNDFIEKHHEDTLYKKGEKYPKNDYEAVPDRVAFLQIDKNKYGIPFLGPELNKKENTEKTQPENNDADENQKLENEEKAQAKKTKKKETTSSGD